MSTMLQSALHYAERGWRIIPLHGIDKDGVCTCGLAACSDTGKHPRVKQWKKAASRDPEVIKAWFGKGSPPTNIGLCTGEGSGITVIDIDIGPNKEGDKTWAELTREKGEPNTLMAETGGGGMHAVFKYNSALKTSKDTLGPGVDCRNDSGYIVAPPSVHRSGKKYKWINWGTEVSHLPAHLSKADSKRGRPRKGDVRRSKVGLSELREMLEHVSSEDRDMWRNVGVILGREYARSEEAWALYNEWSDKGLKGPKGRNHDQIMHEAFHLLSQEGSTKQLSMGTLVKAALSGGWVPKRGNLPLEYFVYYAPGNNYIYRPTGDFWIASAVNAGCSPINKEGKLIDPADYIQANSFITSMTCDPLIEEEITKDKDVRAGDLIESPGGAIYNTYRRPTIELGDARLAKPFVEHVLRIFPKDGDSDQFLNYLAHRVQFPGIKPRFALLIAGEQGTGKDTAVEFCVPAIGAWNIANIDPSAFELAYNEYECATLVRISETSNLHDMSKWAFNERTKVLIAGNPDFVEINKKYGEKFSVRRYCGVILTTNHLATGIYIPPDDRRYDVIESATKREMGFKSDEDAREYFTDLWNWFREEDGDKHVAAFLNQRDLSSWSPTAQRKTAAHRQVVQTGRQSDEWLIDAIEACRQKRFVRSDSVIAAAVSAGMKDSEVKAKLSHAMGRLGYVQFNCSTTGDGRWRVKGNSRYARVYALSDEGRPTSAEIETFLESSGEKF